MKKLTLIGIAMVLLAILLFYSSSLQFENNFANSTQQSTILTPHNSIAIPFQITNTTILGTFYYSNSSNVSYYLVNSAVFYQISPYLNSSEFLNQSVLYEGKGLYELLYRNSSGTFPDESASLKSPDYYYNGTAILSPGTYYNIFQNNGNTSAIVYYSIVQKLQISVNNSILSSALYGLFAAFLLLAGIGIIGYSVIFKKDDLPKTAVDEKRIDALYAKYDRKKAAARHAKPAKKARKKKKQK